MGKGNTVSDTMFRGNNAVFPLFPLLPSVERGSRNSRFLPRYTKRIAPIGSIRDQRCRGGPARAGGCGIRGSPSTSRLVVPWSPSARARAGRGRASATRQRGTSTGFLPARPLAFHAQDRMDVADVTEHVFPLFIPCFYTIPTIFILLFYILLPANRLNSLHLLNQ